MEEKELLQDLLSENAQLRQTATKALWDLWLSQAGEKAESRILTGTKHMDKGQYELAQQEFENLPLEATDQKLDIIITEKEIIEFKHSK